MRRGLCLLLLLSVSSKIYCERVPHLISLGGGYYHGGQEHASGLAQIEYKANYRFWGHVRPQASFATFGFNSAYLCAGLAFELYLCSHLLICPNFSPGIYWKGSGKDLGFPLEFRSCLEIAYETEQLWRVGFQFYHISNASLGKKNPGSNASVLYLAMPICLQ